MLLTPYRVALGPCVFYPFCSLTRTAAVFILVNLSHSMCLKTKHELFIAYRIHNRAHAEEIMMNSLSPSPQASQGSAWARCFLHHVAFVMAAAAFIPASRPVHHATQKLKPPIRPCTSSTSPHMCTPAIFLLSMLAQSMSLKGTPPPVTSACVWVRDGGVAQLGRLEEWVASSNAGGNAAAQQRAEPQP